MSHANVLTRLVLVVCAAALIGCQARPVQTVANAPTATNWLRVVTNSPGGELAVASQNEDGAALTGGFESGLYALGPDNNTLTVLLYDGPLDNPTQAVTLRMFWEPRAGKTPIDATATNATIHYVIFSQQSGDEATEVGVYSGAGFFFPDSDPGDAQLNGGVWDANLVLLDQTEKFTDLLGQASLRGKLAAKRDDLATDRAIRRLNRVLRQRLGYPRLVNGPIELPAPRLANRAD